MSTARIGTHISWGLIALLSVGVGGYALYHTATGFVSVPPEVKANAFFSPLGLQTHIAASGVALLVGAFQFLKVLRTKFPAIHRWMGRIYIAACLVGGLAGGSIALYSSAGLVAGWGFFLLAVLWVPFTLMAWIRALQRNFVDHERWMIRSFALTFAAVTLRLYLPVGIIFITQGEFLPAYIAIAWLAWAPNLIIAELWIAMRRPRRRRRDTEPAPAEAPA
jgi:uncharacterized membrane protein